MVSVNDTSSARISGVKALARTASQRKPNASPNERDSVSPRTTRLITASSHRITVRNAQAPNTIAYCRRKPVLVKSTWVVEFTPLDSLLMIQAAASAVPSAIEPSGSVAKVAAEPTPEAMSLALWQASFAGPIRMSQGSTAMAQLLEPQQRLGELAGRGWRLEPADRGGPVPLGDRRPLPVAVRPAQRHGGGVPGLADRAGRGFTGQPDDAHRPHVHDRFARAVRLHRDPDRHGPGHQVEALGRQAGRVQPVRLSR